MTEEIMDLMIKRGTYFVPTLVAPLWVIRRAEKDPSSVPPYAVRKAKEFSPTEMEQRCYRALAEKRRFGKLRSATDQMIDKIKYLNRLAIDLEKGRIDRTGGQQELDQVQGQLLDIVKSLRQHAGVEDLAD
jgi:hypothetical protein